MCANSAATRWPTDGLTAIEPSGAATRAAAFFSADRFARAAHPIVASVAYGFRNTDTMRLDPSSHVFASCRDSNPGTHADNQNWPVGFQNRQSFVRDKLMFH